VTRYLAARLMSIVPVLFGVTLLVFVLSQLAPGDPASILAGPEATQEDIERLREALGLNAPMPVQYWNWLSRVLRGDLGESVVYRAPVFELLLGRFQNTLSLAVAGQAAGVIFGLALGIASAVRAGSSLDRGVMVLALFGTSMPTFWLGMVLIVIFSVQLAWLPSGGMFPIREEPNLGTLLRHLILPAMTMGLVLMGVVARLTRSAVLEELTQDYVRTARSKGLGERVVVLRHALRNAALPIVTIIGTQFGFLLGGAILAESVFAWPGVGLLIYQAIGTRDYVLIQGGVLLFALTFTMVNLATDVLYAYFDPRIRYGE
jgi:peptide/nickel transport system permease protein